MSRTIAPEAIKADNINSMGKDLGELYTAIWNEVVWLHMKWGECVELYGTRKSRIELLNKTASRFFRILQDIFLEDIILHISRLTDNP